ncbi:MAG TPA: trp RNA-binding attenuation protein MtrB, partial [Chloroflexi bacterium]|nr:trp RNA-binding attenuation protein MtrB [Chloroflexota bacterium]
MEKSEEEGASTGRYVVVKALEDGVVIMGLTRGKDTRSHHSERLDAGEV